MIKIDKTLITSTRAMTQNAIKKEIAKIMRYTDSGMVRVTNYHYEEDSIYTNDIEIQLWEGNDILDTIVVKTDEVSDISNLEWWDVVEVFEKKSQRTKEKLFEWLKDIYSDEDYQVTLEKGYWQ